MSWIPRIEMDMSISRTILESKFDNPFMQSAQKIAIYAVIPFTLIAMFEAIVKNFLCINLANCAITLLNISHNLYQTLCRSLSTF
ncbi:MAG: hypothetical protein KGQ49_00060 [Verrucomicrobia bacterium]|nr:hypothetical protein [Verrucomicrobiota bacterium]MBU6445772.1 hypothetical protein [Verrucomicrobiota bacterium]